MIADTLLAALADPTRRRIFELVAEQPSPVGELAARLPVTRPAVSQHLKVLRTAGLVLEERVGTRHIYRLDPFGLEATRADLHSILGVITGRLQGDRRAVHHVRSIGHRGGTVTTTTDTIVRRSVVVDAPIDRAFTFFTCHIGEWWDEGHHLLQEPLKEG